MQTSLRASNSKIFTQAVGRGAATKAKNSASAIIRRPGPFPLRRSGPAILPKGPAFTDMLDDDDASSAHLDTDSCLARAGDVEKEMFWFPKRGKGRGVEGRTEAGRCLDRFSSLDFAVAWIIIRLSL